MKPIVCIALLAILVFPAEGSKTETPAPKAKLWAGLTVTSPATAADAVAEAKSFMVSFALVNDGEDKIDPEIAASRFLVNGKELKSWDFTIANGPRDQRFTSLAPGQSLQFGYAMGQHFSEPGIYKIQWKGKSFESQMVEFRVLPPQRK